MGRIHTIWCQDCLAWPVGRPSWRLYRDRHCGPFFENRAEIERAATGCRRLVRLVDAPESVRDLMLETDLAISGGGQTLYELTATGTPTVAVQMADNQAVNLQALGAEGVVRVAGYMGEAGLLAGIAKAVPALLAKRDARAEMSAAGRRLLDGRGAVRVADEIHLHRSLAYESTT